MQGAPSTFKPHHQQHPTEDIPSLVQQVLPALPEDCHPLPAEYSTATRSAPRAK